MSKRSPTCYCHLWLVTCYLWDMRLVTCDLMTCETRYLWLVTCYLWGMRLVTSWLVRHETCDLLLTSWYIRLVTCYLHHEIWDLWLTLTIVAATLTQGFVVDLRHLSWTRKLHTEIEILSVSDFKSFRNEFAIWRRRYWTIGFVSRNSK